MSAKLIPDSVDNAIKNLTDKPTQAIGQTISDIWFLVFGRVTTAAEKKKLKYAHDVELFKQQLEDETAKIPADQQTDPDIQVAAQALEASKYCVGSEQLREMFAKLIAGTMNKSVSPYVHPSFSEVLKQCNETDAQLIKYLKKKNSLPVADICLAKPQPPEAFTVYAANVFLPYDRKTCETISLSGSFLQRVGIIDIFELRHLENIDLYHSFEDLPVYKKAKADADLHSLNLKLMPKMCSLTTFGRALIHVCVD